MNSTITLFDDMQTAGDWSSGSADTVNFHSGTQAIKFTTTSDSAVTCRKDSCDATLKSGIGFWVHVDDLTLLRTLKVVVYLADWNTRSATIKFDGATPHSNYYPLESGKWCYIWLDSHQFSGDAAWGSSFALDKLAFQLTRTAGGSNPVVTIDNIVIDVPTMGAAIMMFDDAKDGVYTNGYPLLKARGYEAGIPIISGSVGDAGKCTLAQLQELYVAGWDMLNHTSTHPVMRDQPESTIREIISTCKDYLIANGLRRGSNMFVWPGNNGAPIEDIASATPATEIFTISGEGDLSAKFPVGSTFEVIQSTGNDGTWTVSAIGYADPVFSITVSGDITDATADGYIVPWWGRDIVSEYAVASRGVCAGSVATKEKSLQDDGCSYIPDDWLQLPYFGVAENYSSPKTWADDFETAAQAIIDRGGVLIIYMHDVVAAGGQDGTDVTPTILEDMLDWLDAQEGLGKLEVLTPTQWLGGATSRRSVGEDTGATIADVENALDQIKGDNWDSDKHSLDKIWNKAGGRKSI